MVFDTLSLIVVLVLGLLAVAGGLYMLRNMKRTADKGALSRGKIVAMHTEKNALSNIYFPEVEFRTEDGKLVTHRLATGSSSSAYIVGEEVDVIFSREDPSDFIIKGNAAASFAIMLLFAGMILVFFSLFKLF